MSEAQTATSTQRTVSGKHLRDNRYDVTNIYLLQVQLEYEKLNNTQLNGIAVYQKFVAEVNRLIGDIPREKWLPALGELADKNPNRELVIRINPPGILELVV